MNFRQMSITWYNPTLHSIVAMIISLLTAFIAFGDEDLSRETITTFGAYYLVLGLMTILFILRNRLTDIKTRQLLQFSFILFGFVLMITGVLGIMNSQIGGAYVFLPISFLPGLATMRAGLHFKKTGE